MPDGSAKESTILSCSEALIGELIGIRSILSNAFDRAPEPTKEGSECKAVSSNVLNDILDNLSIALSRTKEISAFLSNAVIPKII